MMEFCRKTARDARDARRARSGRERSLRPPRPGRVRMGNPMQAMGHPQLGTTTRAPWHSNLATISIGVAPRPGLQLATFSTHSRVASASGSQPPLYVVMRLATCGKVRRAAVVSA